MSSYPRDTAFDITPVKNKGQSKGSKGAAASSKTPSVPNLIPENKYTTPKGTVGQGTSKANTYRSSGRAAPAQGQGIQYGGSKNPGKSSISELPGQYTGVPKSGGE